MGRRTAALLLLLLLVVGASSARLFRVPLDANSTFSWNLDYAAGTVSVEVHVPAAREDWVAVGFSDYGSLVGADLCVMWRDWRGRTHMQVGLQWATAACSLHLFKESVAQK
jgi:hypothetical protein